MGLDYVNGNKKEWTLSQDLMNYDRMTQLALRGVVRDAIRRVIREDGLPGAHHFYITFLTRYPGVDVDESLAKKYADEVTIVLEHQYWDLKAHDDCFEVTLKFGGVPKYLSVPYTAVTRFHDPSVGFALQFDVPEDMQDAAPPTPRTPLTLATLTPEIAPVTTTEATPVSAPKSKPKAVKPAAKKTKTPAKATAKLKTEGKADSKGKKTTTPDATPEKDDANKVVSLDAFRKK